MQPIRNDSYNEAMSNIAAYNRPPRRTLTIPSLHGDTLKFMEDGQFEQVDPADPGTRYMGEPGHVPLIMYANGTQLHHPKCVNAVMMLPAEQDPIDDTCFPFNLNIEELSILDSMGHVGNCCLKRNSDGKLIVDGAPIS